MKYFVKKQIGKHTASFEVEGKNLMECLQEAAKLSFDSVTECGMCGSDNLKLDFHIAAKKFKYAHITCCNCRSTLNFSQQLENPDIFYLDPKKKWSEYKFINKEDEIESPN